MANSIIHISIQFNPVQSNSIQVHPVQSSFNPMQYTSIQVHTIQSSFNPVQSTTIQVHKSSIQFQSNSKNTIQLNPAQVNPALLQSTYTQIQSNLTPALLQSSYVSIHLTSSTTPGNIHFNSRKHTKQSRNIQKVPNNLTIPGNIITILEVKKLNPVHKP